MAARPTEFDDPRRGCNCSRKCTFIATTQQEMNDLYSSLSDADKEENEIIPHCYRCLKTLSDRDSNDNEYFLCQACETQAPECECGSWNVGPSVDSRGRRGWGTICQKCINEAAIAAATSGSYRGYTSRKIDYGAPAESKSRK